MDVNLSKVKDNSFIFCKGASFGCVYVTVLISLALQKPICQNLAMTGQISIKGKIGYGGGIDQKVTAAVEAGLENVIIPKHNRKDFEALPPKIKGNVTVHYAETFEDIYKIAFESDLNNRISLKIGVFFRQIFNFLCQL